MLHVALGRAEDWVQCSWARERTAYGRRVTRQATPWLTELERAAGSTRVEPVDRKAATRRGARDLGALDSPVADESHPPNHAVRRRLRVGA